jgi:hypothetical protein
VAAIAAIGMKTQLRDLATVGLKPVLLMLGETVFLACSCWRCSTGCLERAGDPHGVHAPCSAHRIQDLAAERIRAVGNGHAVGPRRRHRAGGGKAQHQGLDHGGVAYRTVSQDSDLLADVNSSLVGIRGTALTPTTGRNQDDGNLNFNKGDPVSQVVNGYLSLEYTSGAYGARASAKAWYDYALARADHPWGNIPSGYQPDAPLSDAGAQMRTRFSGAVLDNLYVTGRHHAGTMPLEWSLGWQKLDWGNRYLVLGGLRDLNPIDIPALTRPGMLQREQETRIPVPQIFARLGVAPSTSIEGFYQFHFERNAPNQCGSFYSGVDWLSDGCNAVLVGNLSDRAALAAGSFLKRADNVMPSNAGQFGAALMHTGRRLGDQVRLLRHAVPFAHGLQRRDQVTEHHRGAIRAGRSRRPESEVLHRVSREHQDVRRELRDHAEGRHRLWRADLPSEPAAAVQRCRSARRSWCRPPRRRRCGKRNARCRLAAP